MPVPNPTRRVRKPRTDFGYYQSLKFGKFV